MTFYKKLPSVFQDIIWKKEKTFTRKCAENTFASKTVSKNSIPKEKNIPKKHNRRRDLGGKSSTYLFSNNARFVSSCESFGSVSCGIMTHDDLNSVTVKNDVNVQSSWMETAITNRTNFQLL